MPNGKAKKYKALANNAKKRNNGSQQARERQERERRAAEEQARQQREAAERQAALEKAEREKNKPEIIEPKGRSFDYYKNDRYVPKHITVDLDGKTTATTGANLSSRQIMKVRTEKGEEIKGFFTRNEYNNAESIFASRMSDKKPPAAHEELGQLVGKITASAVGVAGFYNRVNTCAGDLDKLSGMLTDYYHIPAALLSNIKTDEKINHYIQDMFTTAQRSLGLINIHEQYQKQSSGTNVNRRNNLISDFAELLDASGIIARSSSMTIKDGETEIHGSFMVGAEGLEYNELNPKTEGFMREGPDPTPKTLVIDPDAYEEISDMQVVDCLCANLDRHQNNIFYKVDTSDPDTVKIVGVQGIDNDASFGKIYGNEKQQVIGYMSNVSDILYMNKKTADKLMSLKPDDLENKLRTVRLGKSEIEATIHRLYHLQDRIRNNKIRLVEHGKWKDIVNTDSFKRKVEYADKDNANIYHFLHKVVRDNYNIKVKSGKPDAFPDVKKSDADIPTLKAISVEDKYGLGDHLEYLKDLQTSIKLLQDDQKGFTEDFKKVNDKLNETVKLMTSYHKLLTEPAGNEEEITARQFTGKLEGEKPLFQHQTHILTDVQRNRLIQSLEELNKEADSYMKKTDAVNRKNFLAGYMLKHDLTEEEAEIELKQKKHYADCQFELDSNASDPFRDNVKNIKVYSSFARGAVKFDSVQADKDEASRMLDEFIRANKIRTDRAADKTAEADGRKWEFKGARHTYESLADRVKGIEGRSTQFYKDMMQAFQDFNKYRGSKNSVQKQTWCDKLEKTARDYLKHKVPDAAARAKLNTKEKNRVRFAEDLLEYAIATKYDVVTKTRLDAKKKDDFDKMTVFRDQCKQLVRNYNAAEPEQKDAAKKAILKEKENFAEGFQNVIDISEHYIPTDKMQAACVNTFKEVSEFMQTFLALKNEDSAEKSTNAYEALGLDPALSQNVKRITKSYDDIQKWEAKEKEKASALVRQSETTRNHGMEEIDLPVSGNG